MHCQRCKKAVATVHLTEVLKNENREKHLCERCAAEEGVVIQAQAPSIQEILSNFVTQQSAVQELSQLRCPKCQMSLAEFRNTGLLGCPHDYETFEQALVPIIERSHEGGTRHVGKSPRRLGVPRDFQAELARLRRSLASAVENEDYETAARLRDQINTIETR